MNGSLRLGLSTRVRIVARAGVGILVGGVCAVVPLADLPGHAATPHRVTVPGDAYGFDAPDAAALVGSDLYVANGGGDSVTEVSASKGTALALLGAPAFGFDGPTAIQAVGTQLFVANGEGNSLTEFTAGTNSLVGQISGPQFQFDDPTSMTELNGDLFVLNAGGSVTEVDATTGQFVGLASGTQFGFDGPTSIAASGVDLFVTNAVTDSVTEISAASLAFVATVSGPSYQFAQPSGIVAEGSRLWVTNQAASSVTVFSGLTGSLVGVIVSGNLPTPGPITSGDGYVFTASPPGASPMVSQIDVHTGIVTWMMCNTNGPYLFDNPQALIVTHADLWVVNEGGNSLTEMNADSGALVRTVS
jgi:hypothetical protein